MPRLIVFNHVSLDGYFVDANGDMSWAKSDHQDAEWNSFVAENASGGGALVFGRVTYDRTTQNSCHSSDGNRGCSAGNARGGRIETVLS